MTLAIPSESVSVASIQARRMKRMMLVMVVALIGAGATATLWYLAERKSLSWVDHSRNVARLARIGLTRSVDREAAIRGFLLTADSALLAPERDARNVLPSLLSDIERETIDDELQHSRALRLRKLVIQWEQEMNGLLAAGAFAGLDDAARLSLLRHGRTSINGIRKEFRAFIDTEDALYAERQQHDVTIRNWGILLLLVELAAIAGVARWSDRHILLQAEEIAGKTGELHEKSVELKLTSKKAQIAARDREKALAHLDAAIQSAPNGIAFVDENGLFSNTNASFREMLSVSGSAQAASLADLSETNDSELRDAISEVWRTGTATTTEIEKGDSSAAGPSTQRRTWTLRSYPVAVDSRTIGVGVIVSETSEQRRLEQALRQSQKMEAIGQLAGGVAHDFNNFLTVINSYGELLLSELGSSPHRGDVEEIVKAAERASALTKQLLAFSRNERIQLITLDLNEVVAGLEGMLGRLIGGQVQVVAHFWPQLPLIRADRGQLEQIILNLALNARDAMPAGGRLTIGTSMTEIGDEDSRLHPGLSEGSYVLLTVSDTGEGMNAETAARVFEPFFTTKTRGRGTGLGLSTVYGIVHQFGGHVSVYSEPGQGSMFRVWLPVSDKLASVRQPVREHRIRNEVGIGKTILVVDDEMAIREVVARVLRRDRHKVLLAPGGREALELCGQLSREGKSIDLLITDVIMPETNGLILAEQVRSVFGAVPVIYMSGYTASHVDAPVEPTGAQHFIEKPFTVNQMLACVTDVLSPEITTNRTLPES
jgi:signal transduction histidine kinase/ActR/RegA family two-component response regulator